MAEVVGVQDGVVEDRSGVDVHPPHAQRGLDGRLNDDPSRGIDAEENLNQTSLLGVHLVHKGVVNGLVAFNDGRIVRDTEVLERGLVLESVAETLKEGVEGLVTIEEEATIHVRRSAIDEGKEFGSFLPPVLEKAQQQRVEECSPKGLSQSGR